jgi:mannan endo-1,4-beta-mannosidase
VQFVLRLSPGRQQIQNNFFAVPGACARYKVRHIFLAFQALIHYFNGNLKTNNSFWPKKEKMHQRFGFRILLVSSVMISLALVYCVRRPAHPQPVNPQASKEARALLDFLYQIHGKYVLAGQHNGVTSVYEFNEAVLKITGSYPALWGCDFSWKFHGLNPDSVRQAMIDRAKASYQKGQIITLMWHCCYPPCGDECEREDVWVWKNTVSPAEWDSLTTPGTRLNTQWRAQADKVANLLKQLRDAHIPVLWRPYHEMNGVWFWWCQQPGRHGFARLWNMMYDYFTHHHQLNNLLWVWNTNAPRDIPGDEARAYAEYFPGIETVDILAADVYRKDWKQSHHDDLLKLAQGKLIALGEVGTMPSPEIVAAQPQWVWFMEWAQCLHTQNNPDSVRMIYNAPCTLTLDEIVRQADGSLSLRVQ